MNTAWQLLHHYKSNEAAGKLQLPSQMRTNKSIDKRLWCPDHIQRDPALGTQGYHQYRYALGHDLLGHPLSPWDEEEVIRVAAPETNSDVDAWRLPARITVAQRARICVLIIAPPSVTSSATEQDVAPKWIVVICYNICSVIHGTTADHTVRNRLSLDSQPICGDGYLKRNFTKVTAWFCRHLNPTPTLTYEGHLLELCSHSELKYLHCYLQCHFPSHPSHPKNSAH